MPKYKYAVIDVKPFLVGFHERAKQWDDNYIRLMHLAVLNELRCRIGQQTWSKFIDDFKKCSMVVGSCDPTFMNEVQ